MRAGIAFLVIAYMLSQFYRAFLAVLSPVLMDELGASTADLARASGLWFLCFAAMQLPVGWALDRIGPRRTAASLFLIGAGGGATIFALAQTPDTIIWAMMLIGVGCAPILMATYYIFARQFSAAIFGTLAGVTVGLSSLGNIASATPLAWLIAMFGWRATVGGFAALTVVIAFAIALIVRDPQKPVDEAKGSLMDLLRMPQLWPVMVMMFVCYAPAAGLRGLWISPYLADRFDAALPQIGTATLIMGLAMVLGNFLYGPADRLFGGRKRPILIGNGIVALLCLCFWISPPQGFGMAVALFALIGLCGASYPLVISHGRSFCPPHLTGRGVTLLNLFGMGGAGVMQFATGPTYATLSQTSGPLEAYGALFGIIGVVIIAGLALYLWSKDSTG